jgi:hypothetical protein
MANQLFKYQVFTQQSGRKIYDTSDKDAITESAYLLGLGADVLARRQVLVTDYKCRMKKIARKRRGTRAVRYWILL